MAQNEAVYKFVLEALQEVGKTVAEGDKLKDYVGKDVRKIVRQKLFDGFKAGKIKLLKEKDDSKLKKYCSGLIKNWVIKDKRFN